MPLQPGGLPPVKITVGGVDFTEEAQNVMFASSDPGGYETCSFDLQDYRADVINPGDRIKIMDGLKTVWDGRVAEPAKTIQKGWHVNRKINTATTRVSGEGAGACLKDADYSMIYVDRDLTRWQDPSIPRQIALNLVDWQMGSWQVGADITGSRPALVAEIDDSWSSPYKPIVEIYYDAGPNNLVDGIYIAVENGPQVSDTDTNWGAELYFSQNIDATGILESPASALATTNVNFAGFCSVATPYRFVLLQFAYNATPAGLSGAQYLFFWTNVAVYGNHGLTQRGPLPAGFYTSDIALHAALDAINQGAFMKIGRIDQVTDYIVPHYVQYMPIDHDTVEQDMAKLGAYHYGVWESSSMFDDTPEFTIQEYDSAATVFTTLADCNEADVSERLANLYTSCTITYQDAAGTEYAITVSLPNALLQQVGIQRTNVTDIGLSSTPAAEDFASYVLQILFEQARTAGSVTLPKWVRNAAGAPVKSYWLKAGIDRIRIGDLPTRAATLTPNDTDSFRISRIENNVDTTTGEVTSRVELDAGPNLIETLTARFNIASLLGGQG